MRGIPRAPPASIWLCCNSKAPFVNGPHLQNRAGAVAVSESRLTELKLEMSEMPMEQFEEFCRSATRPVYAAAVSPAPAAPPRPAQTLVAAAPDLPLAGSARWKVAENPAIAAQLPPRPPMHQSPNHSSALSQLAFSCEELDRSTGHGWEGAGGGAGDDEQPGPRDPGPAS